MNAPITAHSTVAALVDVWVQQLRAEDRLETSTINEYERCASSSSPGSATSASMSSRQIESTGSSPSWLVRARTASARSRS